MSVKAPPDEIPSVVLDHGTFIGKRFERTNAYLGILYAQPPVGNLRFRQAVAPEPYSGTYNASEFGDVCP